MRSATHPRRAVNFPHEYWSEVRPSELCCYGELTSGSDFKSAALSSCATGALARTVSYLARTLTIPQPSHRMPQEQLANSCSFGRWLGVCFFRNGRTPSRRAKLSRALRIRRLIAKQKRKAKWAPALPQLVFLRGSTSGTGAPGVANPASDDRDRLVADAYSDCVRRQQLNAPQLNVPQPPTGVSDPILLSPQLKDRKR